MSAKKKESLADKIANLLVTAPVSLDPEDEITDETRAQINEPIEDVDETEEELLSKFRKQNIDLLSEVDNRYAGKKESRKNLRDSDESSEDEFSSDEDQVVDNNLSIEGSDEQDDADENDSDEYEDGTDDDDSDDNEIDDDQDRTDDEDNVEGDMFTDETRDSYKHMKETDVSAHIKKGLSVRNQLSIWENLLEMRIQLQKSVIAANKLPNYVKHAEIKESSGPQFTNKVEETKKSVSNLLDKLLLLQNLVLKRYPETKKLNESLVEGELSDGDEEIPSDTEESTKSEDEEDITESPHKKRKLSDFESNISTMHKTYKNYRNSVIQKWHDKTRIAVMKNNATTHSIINHIEHTLNDREKLQRRTQLKKSDYQIVGEECVESENNNDDNMEASTNKQYNTEIFDDDDFYHQLLRELIEVKSADLTDPVKLGRQWIQLQNLRSKMKRKIDTKATKGRKIRYAVHSKLVNFMAPIEENSWTDEAKTELYSSLFGKNK